VAYFDEVDWDDDGYWEIEYVDRAGNSVEIRLDPVTGQPRR
jgi:peptidase YpeB-like protein